MMPIQREINTDLTVVFSFGVPRSGTTLMFYALQMGHGYLNTRINEGTPLHPRNDYHGLLALVKTFVYRRVVFVRTIRHPVDVVNSWLVVHPEVLEDRRKFEDFLDMYEAESDGVKKAREEIFSTQYGEKPSGEPRIVDVTFAEIQYENLGDQRVREKFFRKVSQKVPDADANFWKWNSYVESVWNVEPVRKGRLQSGIMHQQLPDDWLQQIRSELSKVIERENLAGTSQLVDW